MKKFNFKFLDRLKKNKKTSNENDHEDEIQDEIQDKEKGDFGSSESSEDFAERTLKDINLNKFKKELNELEDEKWDESSESGPPKSPKFNFTFKIPNFSFKKKNNAEGPSSKPSKEKQKKSFEQFSWNDFIQNFFSPHSRSKIHGAFLILFVAAIAYITGKTIALYLSPITPVVKAVRIPLTEPLEVADTTIQDINRIASINLFNLKESDKAEQKIVKKDIDSIVCLDALTPTQLQIKLLDTIVLQDSIKSVASVQIRGSSELMNIREGERLDEMAEVSKINRMRLILKNLQTGDCEYAASDAEKTETAMPNLKIFSPKEGKALFKSTNPNIKNTGNNFKIKKTFRDSMLTNMSEVLTQAKAVQITNPDGTLSFKMTEIVPGSIYSLLNIQENDTVDSINGKKIENLNELMGLLGKIKEIDRMQIGLKHDGANQNLEFVFE